MADLKPVYQAVSKEAAEEALLLLDEKWGKNILLYFNLGKISEKIYLCISNTHQRLEKLFILLISSNQCIDNLENSQKQKEHFQMKIHY